MLEGTVGGKLPAGPHELVVVIFPTKNPIVHVYSSLLEVIWSLQGVDICDLTSWGSHFPSSVWEYHHDLIFVGYMRI